MKKSKNISLIIHPPSTCSWTNSRPLQIINITLRWNSRASAQLTPGSLASTAGSPATRRSSSSARTSSTWPTPWSSASRPPKPRQCRSRRTSRSTELRTPRPRQTSASPNSRCPQQVSINSPAPAKQPPVEFKRIINNIMNALHFLHTKRRLMGCKQPDEDAGQAKRNAVREVDQLTRKARKRCGGVRRVPVSDLSFLQPRQIRGNWRAAAGQNCPQLREPIYSDWGQSG